MARLEQDALRHLLVSVPRPLVQLLEYWVLGCHPRTNPLGAPSELVGSVEAAELGFLDTAVPRAEALHRDSHLLGGFLRSLRHPRVQARCGRHLLLCLRSCHCLSAPVPGHLDGKDCSRSKVDSDFQQSAQQSVLLSGVLQCDLAQSP